MPIDIINNQDEDKDKINNPSTQPQQAQAGSIYSSVGGPSSNAPGTPSASPNRGGTGFTNLSRILGANVNNRLGQVVGSGVQKSVGQVKDQLNQAQQGFRDQSEANRLDTDTNKQKVVGTLQNIGFNAPTSDYFKGVSIGSGPNNTPGAGPNQPSDQDTQDFSKFIAGNYAGPQTLQNEEQLLNKAQNAEQVGKGIATQQGRLDLLNRYVGGKNYNLGQKRLDSLLLGQSATPQLNQARRDATGLGQYANNQSDIARQVAQDYANKAKEFGTQTVDALSGAGTEEQNNLSNLSKQEQDRINNEYSNLRSDLSSGNLTDEEMSKLGVNEGQYLFGEDLTKGIGNVVPTANDQNVASAADYSKIQALQKLGGNAYNPDLQAYLGKFTDPTQAATFQKNTALGAYSTPADQLKSALQGRQANTEGSSDYQTAQKSIYDTNIPLQHINDVKAAAQGLTQQLPQLQQNIDSLKASLPQGLDDKNINDTLTYYKQIYPPNSPEVNNLQKYSDLINQKNSLVNQYFQAQNILGAQGQYGARSDRGDVNSDQIQKDLNAINPSETALSNQRNAAQAALNQLRGVQIKKKQV